MFRIGEFSKMGMTTVKTLRYYDEEGLLKPKAIDAFTGYRMYTGDQLTTLHRIQSLRQVGIPIAQVRRILNGEDATVFLQARAAELDDTLREAQDMLSRIHFILEGKQEEQAMSYTATIKHLPACPAYTVDMVMPSFDSYFTVIPALGEKLKAKYPDLKCATPEYCFMINRDREWRETDNHVTYGEAVTKLWPDFDDFHFLEMPALDVVSVMHTGPYEDMEQAFAFAVQWIEANGYTISDDPRCSYIDGIWNKQDSAEWLTEVQIPVTKA